MRRYSSTSRVGSITATCLHFSSPTMYEAMARPGMYRWWKNIGRSFPPHLFDSDNPVYRRCHRSVHDQAVAVADLRRNHHRWIGGDGLGRSCGMDESKAV